MQWIAGSLIQLGFAGLIVVLALNGYAHFVKAQPAAVPFSDYWWLSWFPAYLVWLVFLVAGYRGRARAKEQSDV